MMRTLHSNVLKIVLAMCLISLASCSKLSDVGDQEEPAPKAVASSIGEEFTNDSGGNMTMTVRAGADVILTGKESEKGADDSGVPLINFKWKQSDNDPVKVQLIGRTTNTVTFAAPQVTTDNTELHFTLTVSDAKGASDTAQATVTIKNVRDPDHFLQYLSSATDMSTFSITLASSNGQPTATGNDPVAQFPITVKMTKLVTFKDRGNTKGGAATFTVPVGQTTTVVTGWTQKLGSSTDCASPLNPTIQLPIPRLNQDDLLRIINDANSPLPAAVATADLVQLKSDYPDAVVLSDVLEASDIDSASVAVQIDINSTAGALKPCVKNALGGDIVVQTVGGQVSSIVVPLESSGSTEGLWPVSGIVRDTKQSAQAYYDAIDPGSDKKDTLTKWLDKNGFKPTQNGYGADARAVYTNDYDLGFGRDMYMKFGSCDPRVTPSMSLQQRMGMCDVAAVVLNYPNVEAAAKKLNPFAAVAMEYSKTGTSSERFVKFYTFAPDTRTGEFKRVLSLNFDRRGEQYMPQACTACHGGVPGTVTKGNGGAPDTFSYTATNGNVNAAFLPWDLDSFLYSDTDPGFSTKSRDASLRAQYTRAQQATQFKRLNEGAYLTYADPDPVTPDTIQGRFALAKELVEGWYGGVGLPLPAEGFVGNFLPDGWKPTNNGNPEDSATIYKDVFARNCRACHVMQVPTVDSNNNNALRLCTKSSKAPVNSNSQLQMGCYWEFVRAPNLEDRLSRNQMPFARRTSDRLWVSASSAQAAGLLLRTHLGAQGVTFEVPGEPYSEIILSGVTLADINSYVSATVGNIRFADTIAWSVYQCSQLGNPSSCTVQMAIAGANTLTSKIPINATGDYLVQLRLNSSATPAAVQSFNVPEKSPGLAASANLDFTLGSSFNHLENLLVTLGNGVRADHRISISADTGLSILPSSCVSPGSCPGDTAISMSATVTTDFTPTVTLSVRDINDVAPVTKTYQLTVNSNLNAPVITLCATASTTSSALNNSTALNCSANSSPTIDLLALAGYDGSRTDLAIEFPSGTTMSLPNAEGQRGTVTPTGTPRLRAVQYVPPGRIATHTKTGGVGRTDSGNQLYDQVAYKIVRFDSMGTRIAEKASILRFQIRARETFSNDVMGQFSSLGCTASGCHNLSLDINASCIPGATAVNKPNYTVEANLHAQLLTCKLKNLPANSYVDTSSNAATLGASGLLCYPQRTCPAVSPTHPFKTGATPFSGTDMQMIRQWIEDGANNF